MGERKHRLRDVRPESAGPQGGCARGGAVIGIDTFLETSQGEWAIHTWKPSDSVVGVLRDCNTSPAPSWRLRRRVSRGAAISCIPFPRGPSAASQASLRHHRFPPVPAPLSAPPPAHLSQSFTSSSSSRFSKEERRKFEMTADVGTESRW